MKLLVMRDIFTNLSVLSEISLDGVQLWYGLEPPNRAQKPCCIPPGTFVVKLGWSDHFNMIVPKIQDVPNFTAVEIHPGNFPKDTHACLLVGEHRAEDDVTQSRVAFDELMAKLTADPNNITITYVGGQ